MKQSNRQQRVAQQIQREVALILQREIQGPELSFITVAQVKVSGDLQHAKIYVTFFNDDAQAIQKGMEVLQESTSYIRSLLARALRLRVMPEIAFIYDDTLKEGLRLSALITRSVSDDAQRCDEQPSKPNSESCEPE